MNKFIGLFLGFLFAGPIGGFFGILIGHIFDRNFYNQYDAAARYQNIGIRQLFFETTFLVMGYVAKLEGTVSKASIDNARTAMQAMHLDESSRLQAIHLFNQGKQPAFEIETTLRNFRIVSHQDKALLKQFLVIQTQAAIENGMISFQKKRGLMLIYQMLGFTTVSLNWFEAFIDQAYTSYRQQEGRYDHATDQHNVFRNQYNDGTNPYQTLGIAENATVVEIKQAYRRLINQLHPDKLISKGLSKAKIKSAEQKMIRIQKAYETIARLKGFS